MSPLAETCGCLIGANKRDKATPTESPGIGQSGREGGDGAGKRVFAAGIVAGDFIGDLVEIKYGRGHGSLSKAFFLPKLSLMPKPASSLHEPPDQGIRANPDALNVL